MELRGRTALITGASKGIGRATAELFTEAGATVHCLSRDPSAVEALARTSGGRAWAADLADDAEGWSRVEEIADACGGSPDIVVNSAGAFSVAPLGETTLAQFDTLIDVNLRGSFIVLRSLLPRMLEQGQGDIVNVSSVAGRRAFPSNGAYSASKFGLRGLHEVLLEEIGGTGVRATLLEPAATDTPLWDQLDPDNDPNLPARSQMLRPEDVADAIRYVVSRPPHIRIPLLQIERG